jgi:histone H3/H4
MVTPVADIVVNQKYVFRGCHSFSIRRDVDELSATGSIVLPLSAVRQNRQRELMQVNRTVKAGDAIAIRAGYAETGIREIFSGYVRTVDTGERVTVHVEDAVYLLRRKAIVISELEPLKLKELCVILLKDASLEVSDDAADMTIDQFQHHGNVAGALDQLKKDLSLTVYITADGRLYVGGEQLQRGTEPVRLIYGRNIIENRTAYQFAADKPLLVTVKGKRPDNTEVVVETGMKGGDEQTLYRYNVTDPATLKKIGEEYLLKRNYTGFKGSLKTFFIPFVEMGGTVEYQNENYTDHSGRYFVKAVTHSFGADAGLRQDIELGQRI